MHELNLVDHTFDLKLASEYHLSIQLGLDGFSFCIFNSHQNKYIVFRHIPLIVGKPQFLAQKVEAIFEEEEILNAAFRSVSVIYSTIQATLFPKEFSEPSDYKPVFNSTSDISKTDEIRKDNIAGYHYQLVYSVPKELIALLNRKFSDFQFRHKSMPLFETLISQRNEKRNSLLINFEKKYIRIIAVKGSSIELYNSFYFRNESDFLYYTLNIWQNLQFEAERDEILIGGFVADDSSYIRQLRKYISNIGFLKPSLDYSYGSLFEKIQKHQFVSLLNNHPCES